MNSCAGLVKSNGTSENLHNEPTCLFLDLPGGLVLNLIDTSAMC